jgi:hypothetical protein
LFALLTRCSQHCEANAGLASFEVPFAYTEGGKEKAALVKVVLCGSCAEKLQKCLPKSRKRRREKGVSKRRRRRHKHRETSSRRAPAEIWERLLKI